uniref:Uncharacterized protein n=1 Tax=Parastrongyloides trichosuri TaxID=131310 RepID=A0A0N4ZCN0_PARTI
MQNSSIICLIFVLMLAVKTESYLLNKVFTPSQKMSDESNLVSMDEYYNVPLSKKFNNYRVQKPSLYNSNINHPQRSFLYLSEPNENIKTTKVLVPSESILLPTLYTQNKSGHTKKSLKKFHSSQSRNCFFSPINCMIQHDINKFRKMVDLSP